MARRSEHLLLRGNIWWLRVRVPDALRPIIGKGEIRRSLKTSDGTEAKRRVRIERIKVEAEFDDARAALERQRAAAGGATAARISLTEEQVWALATRWFVEQEKHSTHRPVQFGDAEVIENLGENLVNIERFEEVSASVREEVDKLLAEAGIPPGDGSDEPSAWRAKLSRAIHAGMVEREKRLLNRVTGGAGIVLNPDFHNLSAATPVQPVALYAVTLADLIKRYNAAPTRTAPSSKTKLKQDAQARLFKDVIGGKTLVSAIGREQARKLLDTVKALPPTRQSASPRKSSPRSWRSPRRRS